MFGQAPCHSTPNDIMPADTHKNIKLCRFYMQGKCTFGDTCMFPHSAPNTNDNVDGTPQSQPVKLSAVQICRFYQRGQCTKGNKCTFSHSMEERTPPTSAPTTNPFAPLLAIGPRYVPPCIFFKQGTCRRSASCAYSHEIGAAQNQTSPLTRSDHRLNTEIHSPPESSPSLEQEILSTNIVSL